MARASGSQVNCEDCGEAVPKAPGKAVVNRLRAFQWIDANVKPWSLSRSWVIGPDGSPLTGNTGTSLCYWRKVGDRWVPPSPDVVRACIAVFRAKVAGGE
jgi:hypothetical protein